MYTPEGMEWLSTEPVTMNNHHYGVSPDVSVYSTINAHHVSLIILTLQMFNNTDTLTQFYTILSTNLDREGKEFVSSIEG